jgi:outer membrane lipoprotein-sorting protein
MRALLVLALAVACAAAHAAAFDVDALMALLRATPHAHATFRETKYLKVLETPVETSGELTFTPPDRLEKRTIGLNAETLVADRDSVSIEGAGRKRTLPLAQYPEIGVFVDSIRGTLSGDRSALEKSYTLSVAGTPARWTLTLRPRDAQVARLVSRIAIEGSQGEVRRVEIEQADGDRSVMAITPAAP